MHGGFGDAYNLQNQSQLSAKADLENFIVVYPQGSYFNGTTHWNVGGWTQGSSVDDVVFIDFLIAPTQQSISSLVL